MCCFSGANFHQPSRQGFNVLRVHQLNVGPPISPRLAHRIGPSLSLFLFPVGVAAGLWAGSMIFGPHNRIMLCSRATTNK